MSIASELNALNGYILSAYDEINTKGGAVPTNKNMANLATAISSISGGGGGVTVQALSVNTNGTYTASAGTAYSPVTVDVPQTNFVISAPVSATLAAANWVGNRYAPTLSISGRNAGANGLQVGVMPTSTVNNSTAAADAGLYIVGYVNSSSAVDIDIFATNVPTQDLTIAIFGTVEVSS